MTLGSAAIADFAFGQVPTRNEPANPLRKHIPATLDQVFAPRETELIEQSLAVFYQRFLKGSVTVPVWNLSYAGEYYLSEKELRNSPPRVIRPRTMIDPDYLRRAKEHPDLKWRPYLGADESYFINDQINLMGILCSHGTAFPEIEIEAYWADPEGTAAEDLAWGNLIALARVGAMMVTRKSFDGDFQIKLNRYFLNAEGSKLYRKPVFWAGVIAHELLHNLGHRHPDASAADYDLYQINLWEYGVQTYGKHVYGQRAPVGCAVK